MGGGARAVRAVALLLVATSAASRGAQEGNPVQKVIALLERMQSQIQEEGKTEAASYDKFACFCKEQADEKMYRITKGKGKIEMLSSSIELLEADIAKLDDATAKAKSDIEALQQQMDGDTAQRGSDFSAFAVDRQDLQDAIDRLEEAIADMSGSKGKMAGGGVKTDLLAKGQQVSKAEAAVIAEVDQALKTENTTEAKKAAMLAAASSTSTFDAQSAGSLITSADLTSHWQQAKEWRRRVLQLIGSGKVRPTKQQAEVLLQWSTAARKQSPGGANAFEFSSNKHIEIVKELLKSYKQQMFERETTEANDKHKFLMAQQANQHSLDSLKGLQSKLETNSAAKSEEKGAQEKDREETQQDTDADQSFLDELTEECEKKAKAWDARSQVRSSELTAISEALGIMKEGVAGKYGANKKLVGLVAEHADRSQTRAESEEEQWNDDVDEEQEIESSFLQRRKRSHHRRHRKKGHLSKKEKAIRKRQVEQLLAKRGMSLKDGVLSSLAMKVKEDNFGEVKRLIGDLIKKLEDEAKAAEEESQWCKDEIGSATTKRDENQAQIDKKESVITLGKARIVTLKNEVKGLSDDISELYKALNEQTQLREADHVENEQTLEDTRAGLFALTSAKDVLEKFYNDPTGFLQQEQEQGQMAQSSGKKKDGPDADGNSVSDLAPESNSFTGENTGKQDEAGGIIGLLNVIGKDFERTIESTEQGEKDADADFEKFKSGTQKDIDEKKASKDEKEGEINTTGADNVQNGEDLADAKDLKKSAEEELAKLKPVCMDSGASFQERKRRREEEVAALKEAMKIIDELN